MPPDLALLSTLIGSNYPCLELIFMAPKVFEPLKFHCIWNNIYFLLYFSKNYRDFSVKSKLIILLFQTVKLSILISLFQKIGFS